MFSNYLKRYGRLLLLLGMVCAHACVCSAETTVRKEKGEATVRLPHVRTTEWQVLPYFNVQGAKTTSTTFGVQHSERGHIDIAPSLRTVRSAGTNATWTSEISTHFMPDTTQSELVRGRDRARLGYRFDDGLFWTRFNQELQLDYDRTVEKLRRPQRREQSKQGFQAGHRFRLVDWGLALDRKEQSRRSAEEWKLLREEWDERIWAKLTAVDLFRPNLAVARRDVNLGWEPKTMRRLDADRDILTVGADGALGKGFAWHGRWTGEQVTGLEWDPRPRPSPVEATATAPAWDHSLFKTGVMLWPWRSAPRLDLSFSQEAGYESERQYRERAEWSLRAAQQLTSGWQAQARAGWVDQSNMTGEEDRLMTAGVSTHFRLSHGTHLSGEYSYELDEDREMPVDTQFRLQFKMKW